MSSTQTLYDISTVIQLSVAPVFLLVGIAGFINAFVSRLSRAVDRRRYLQARIRHEDHEFHKTAIRELELLEARVRMVHLGITLGITTALLICLTIVSAFIEYFLGIDNPLLIGALFVLAMFSLIGALLAFLREVFLAIRSLNLSQIGKS